METVKFVRPSRENLEHLSGKVALITGGCSGIGLALLTILLDIGAKVVVGDVQEAPWEDKDSSVFSTEAKERVIYRRCDITDWASLRTLFSAGIEAFGRLDLVAANAGINEFGDQYFHVSHDEKGCLLEPDWRVLDVNVKGTMNTVFLAIHNLAEGGSIVITSSLTGYQSANKMPVYSSSKHGKMHQSQVSNAANEKASTKAM